MPTQVQFRRGSGSENNSFTGGAGEVTVNTDNNALRVHNGSTSGGFELARADLSNVSGIDIVSISGISTVGSLSIGSTEVISGARQLKNITSLDATTTATIESAVSAAPNDFTSLNISGIGTIAVGTVTNLTSTAATITTLRSTTINADTGNIVTGVTTNFTSTNGAITNLTGTAATITTLTSNILTVSGDISASSLRGYNALVGTASSTITSFTVTVVSKSPNHRYFGTGSALGYHIDDIESPFLTLLPGKTYRFTQDDGSNSTHQLLFYYEANRTTQYTTNVTTNGTAGSAGAYTEIVVTDTTPIVLHYQCINHGYMGNAAQFNSNVVDTSYQITARSGINVTGVVTATTFSGSGSGLTNIPSNQLSGALPALDGSALIGLVGVGTGVEIQENGSPVGTAVTINFGTNLDVSFAGGVATVDATGGGGSSQFVTTAAGIHTLSNVGIGTTNPTSKLTVTGGVLVTGVVTATTFVGALTGTASNVTTNANLTGDVTSSGNATSIAAGVIVNADINASAGIVDTKLDTISTAGKVSNSATTATSANTNSAIVARDGSGNFTAGTITATTFSGSGSGLTGLPDFTIIFTISATGSSDYIFSGPGIVAGNTDDPILYLYKGFTYTFINTTGGSHPFAIRESNGGASYTPGVSGSTTGTQTFVVPMNAPSTLYYQCTIHSGMGNVINIV